MLCKPNLDLAETMNCFEVMDPKMDARMQRKLVMSPTKLGLVPTDQLSQTQRLALVEQSLLMFATWQN